MAPRLGALAFLLGLLISGTAYAGESSTSRGGAAGD
jgi:hypothetical protein